MKAAERLAAGDLTGAIQPEGNDETQSLLQAMKRMQDSLSATVQAVQRNARQVAEACETIGFLVITGHGVAQDLIDRTFRTTAAFYDLPQARNAQVRAALAGHAPFVAWTLRRIEACRHMNRYNAARASRLNRLNTDTYRPMVAST